jgi:hypothetical protein
MGPSLDASTADNLRKMSRGQIVNRTQYVRLYIALLTVPTVNDDHMATITSRSNGTKGANDIALIVCHCLKRSSAVKVSRLTSAMSYRKCGLQIDFRTAESRCNFRLPMQNALTKARTIFGLCDPKNSRNDLGASYNTPGLAFLLWRTCALTSVSTKLGEIYWTRNMKHL